jgi:hypothetical protein
MARQLKEIEASGAEVTAEYTENMQRQVDAIE